MNVYESIIKVFGSSILSNPPSIDTHNLRLPPERLLTILIDNLPLSEWEKRFILEEIKTIKPLLYMDYNGEWVVVPYSGNIAYKIYNKAKEKGLDKYGEIAVFELYRFLVGRFNLERFLSEFDRNDKGQRNLMAKVMDALPNIPKKVVRRLADWDSLLLDDADDFIDQLDQGSRVYSKYLELRERYDEKTAMDLAKMLIHEKKTKKERLDILKLFRGFIRKILPEGDEFSPRTYGCYYFADLRAECIHLAIPIEETGLRDNFRYLYGVTVDFSFREHMNSHARLEENLYTTIRSLANFLSGRPKLNRGLRQIAERIGFTNYAKKYLKNERLDRCAIILVGNYPKKYIKKDKNKIIPKIYTKSKLIELLMSAGLSEKHLKMFSKIKSLAVYIVRDEEELALALRHIQSFFRKRYTLLVKDDKEFELYGLVKLLADRLKVCISFFEKLIECKKNIIPSILLCRGSIKRSKRFRQWIETSIL